MNKEKNIKNRTFYFTSLRSKDSARKSLTSFFNLLRLSEKYKETRVITILSDFRSIPVKTFKVYKKRIINLRKKLLKKADNFKQRSKITIIKNRKKFLKNLNHTGFYIAKNRNVFLLISFIPLLIYFISNIKEHFEYFLGLTVALITAFNKRTNIIVPLILCASILTIILSNNTVEEIFLNQFAYFITSFIFLHLIWKESWKIKKEENYTQQRV